MEQRGSSSCRKIGILDTLTFDGLLSSASSINTTTATLVFASVAVNVSTATGAADTLAPYVTPLPLLLELSPELVALMVACCDGNRSTEWLHKHTQQSIANPAAN
jgi:hypothetical protein